MSIAKRRNVSAIRRRRYADPSFAGCAEKPARLPAMTTALPHLKTTPYASVH
jgi:hypothetical protein